MDLMGIGGLATATMAMLLGASFLAAMLGGMSGFGSGLIITIFMAPIVGPKAVLPMLAVIMTITNASRIWFFRGALDWLKVWLVTATAIPASMLGAMLYVRLTAIWVQVVLGLVLILSIPLRRQLSGRSITLDDKALLIFGAVFGFLSSLLIGTGVLIIPMLLGAGLSGPALLATDAAISAITNVSKAAMFGGLDALPPALFALSLAMGAMTIPGTWAAAWLIRRMDLRIHTLFMEAAIVLGGLAMIYGAVA